MKSAQALPGGWRSAAARRNHPAFWAFALHRLSGLALVLFLPVHLWVLGLAIGDGARLDEFLKWTEAPSVKLAETALVVMLALHAAGGLRLLALELLPWRDWQKTLIALAGAAAAAVGILYLLRVW